MICNDFLVVKVNCPKYVFNISKSIGLLRNIKNEEILEKAPESAHRLICLLLQLMMSYQENKQRNRLLEC